MNLYFQRYFLPGLVFQGIVIGGGYATGRELAEFFMPHGPIGGLAAMALSTLIWSAVMSVSFELCRLAQCFDYRSFFQILLGRFWFLYEILLTLLMLIVLSVIAAAAGEIGHTLLNLPPMVGSIFLMLAIAMLSFYGSGIIEKFIGCWSILLYLCYGTLVIWCVVLFNSDIIDNFGSAVWQSGWVWDGARYAGYNLAVVPAVFFCLNHMQQRRHAVGAGIIAGILGMIPAIFLFVAMISQYPNITTAAVPSLELLQAIGSDWFSMLFQLILLGTLVQTGTGLIHSINERISITLVQADYVLSRASRAAIAGFILLVASVLSANFGIVELIANGYGLLTLGFLLVFVVPVLTLGVYQVFVLRKTSDG